ncbi:peptidase [Amylibacter marinus]|uniref:peptidase n=1 Tax=Amylibacter marinus TaxID=1475483 RepID=UPI0024E04698|nr:peptidase [Amylibacter marinus]
MIAADTNQVISVARTWIGTPYQHQASVIGGGADCLGLIRGIWREVVGDDPCEIYTYSSDWGEVSRREVLLEGLERWLLRLPVDLSKSGTVLAFCMRENSIAKHLGVLGHDDQCAPYIIHSTNRTGVVETPLTHAWQRRCVAQFEFPKRIDEWQL